MGFRLSGIDCFAGFSGVSSVWDTLFSVLFSCSEIHKICFLFVIRMSGIKGFGFSGFSFKLPQYGGLVFLHG